MLSRKAFATNSFVWDVCFHGQIICSNIEHLSNIDEIQETIIAYENWKKQKNILSKTKVQKIRLLLQKWFHPVVARSSVHWSHIKCSCTIEQLFMCSFFCCSACLPHEPDFWMVLHLNNFCVSNGVFKDIRLLSVKHCYIILETVTDFLIKLGMKPCMHLE